MNIIKTPKLLNFNHFYVKVRVDSEQRLKLQTLFVSVLARLTVYRDILVSDNFIAGVK